MRFTLLLSATCLMLASACSDDSGKPPTQDLTAVADVKQAAADASKPDAGKPDTQPAPDQKAAGDLAPHFDFTVPKCPNEVNLVGKEPCICGKTLVYDVKTQYPTCASPKVVKCCPAVGEPKCE